MARKIAAGNWKMNGDGASLAEIEALASAHPSPGCDIVICPPATLIDRARAIAGEWIALGGQDCHAAASGAHTGDISVAMLKDAGASHVIAGHSERRQDHKETDAEVRAKAEAALAGGLTVIVCVGETDAQRDSGDTLAVIQSQLEGSLPDAAERLVIAYEPVWAIGTGRTPTLDEIAEVHLFIRDWLAGRFGDGAGSVPLLYGGSVKPSNAAEIFGVAEVDGALVGGASLKASDFSAIVSALEQSDAS
jgi:triosephosphate isomerase